MHVLPGFMYSVTFSKCALVHILCVLRLILMFRSPIPQSLELLHASGLSSESSPTSFFLASFLMEGLHTASVNIWHGMCSFRSVSGLIDKKVYIESLARD